ncbi:histidine kinase [Novosphingobium sp. YAF33]|uniref:histidine kinase n=1 Tax=Novosphingobium sp. YAF33 TaxID=3233082 RepID=UPI003F9AA111
MVLDRPVLLFESDQPVLSSLQFALSLEGFLPADGSVLDADPATAECLVIDQRYRADGIGFLQELRDKGVVVPAILLATNPSRELRRRMKPLGAVLIEKPLLGNELTDALLTIIASSKAA